MTAIGRDAKLTAQPRQGDARAAHLLNLLQITPIAGVGFDPQG